MTHLLLHDIETAHKLLFIWKIEIHQAIHIESAYAKMFDIFYDSSLIQLFSPNPLLFWNTLSMPNYLSSYSFITCTPTHIWIKSYAQFIWTCLLFTAWTIETYQCKIDALHSKKFWSMSSPKIQNGKDILLNHIWDPNKQYLTFALIFPLNQIVSKSKLIQNLPSRV